MKLKFILLLIQISLQSKLDQETCNQIKIQNPGIKIDCPELIQNNTKQNSFMQMGMKMILEQDQDKEIKQRDEEMSKNLQMEQNSDFLPSLPSLPTVNQNQDLNMSSMTGDLETALQNLESDLGSPKVKNKQEIKLEEQNKAKQQKIEIDKQMQDIQKDDMNLIQQIDIRQPVQQTIKTTEQLRFKQKNQIKQNDNHIDQIDQNNNIDQNNIDQNKQSNNIDQIDEIKSLKKDTNQQIQLKVQEVKDFLLEKIHQQRSQQDIELLTKDHDLKEFKRTIDNLYKQQEQLQKKLLQQQDKYDEEIEKIKKLVTNQQNEIQAQKQLQQNQNDKDKAIENLNQQIQEINQNQTNLVNNYENIISELKNNLESLNKTQIQQQQDFEQFQNSTLNSTNITQNISQDFNNQSLLFNPFNLSNIQLFQLQQYQQSLNQQQQQIKFNQELATQKNYNKQQKMMQQIIKEVQELKKENKKDTSIEDIAKMVELTQNNEPDETRFQSIENIIEEKFKENDLNQIFNRYRQQPPLIPQQHQRIIQQPPLNLQQHQRIIQQPNQIPIFQRNYQQLRGVQQKQENPKIGKLLDLLENKLKK